MNIHTEWVALYNGKSPPLFRKKGSAAGQPCKQGQTATRTGCIPKKGKGKYTLVGKGSGEIGEDIAGTSPTSTGDTSVISGKKVKDKGDTRDGKAGTGSDRQGSRSDVGGFEEDSGRVARKAKEPSHESADSQGPSKDTPADREALERLEEKQEALSAINDRIDRYSKVFEKRGDAAAGEWMKVLKDHINKLGIEDALESLGEQKKGGFQGKVQYEGAYDEPGDTEKESTFIRKYLEKAGVILIHGDTTVDSDAPLVSGWSEANLKLEGRDRDSRKGKKGDYIPTEATFKDKLEETQHLPGLESTQDIQEAIGQRVTHFTPEVMRKLDAKYGRGKWIVKSYGEEAYAGFGVMFPERVKQIKRDARALVSAARDELKEHGYKIARDEDGIAIGLSPSKGVFKGHLLHFGSEEFDRLPKAVKILGKQVRQAAPSERGTRLPVSTEDALQNNYGVTLRRGKDGIPNGIIDWDGREHALSSKHVAKMERQDGGALGHDLHRVLEADEWRRDRGFSAEAKYMVGPAFKAVGVSAADRAEGNTWETANEGRVHCITRDGKATVVPYATLAGRSDSMPAVFATKDVRAMEKAVEDTINKLPESERKGQLYAPDVVKTKHGWRVLELNPSAAGGGSDWLGSNPFVIDAIASHVVGREPMHARFIRDLIGKVTSKKELPLDTTKGIGAPKTSGTPKPTPEIEKKLPGLNPGLDQPLGDGKRIGDVKNIRWVPITNGRASKGSFFGRCERDKRGHCVAQGGSTSIHERVLNSFHEQIEDAKLSDKDKKEFKEAVGLVLSSVTEKSALILEKVAENSFYCTNSMEALHHVLYVMKVDKGTKEEIQEVNDMIRDDNHIVGGFASPNYVVLDGGEENYAHQGVYGGKQSRREIAAHELGHIINYSGEHSKSPKWYKAYKEEIDTPMGVPPLSEYAMSRNYPSIDAAKDEGFAEFHRLVHGTEVPSEQIEREFPKATAYFKANDLWRKERTSSTHNATKSRGPILPELFEKRIDIGTKGHADVLSSNRLLATSNMAEDQPRDDHGRFSTIGAVGSVRKLRYGNTSVKFKRLTRKKIDGPRLGLINYRQKDDHSCSYVASLSVVHHFDRKIPAIDVLKAVRPKKAGGLNRYSLQKGLSKLGIETTYKNNLTLATLRKHVEEGTPVMITVFPKDWSSDHWTVVEGFSGDRVHLSNYKSLPIKQFMKEWYSKGEGLICKKRKEGESGTENKSTSVRWVPVAFISNSMGSQGQPCKQGQTVAKTDCIPKDLKGHRGSVDSKAINANDVIGKSNKELLQLLASSRSDNETIHEGREDYKVSSLRLEGVKIYYDPGNRNVRDAVTQYVREISASDIPKEILACTKEIRFLPGKCPSEEWYKEHHNLTGQVHATASRGVVTFWRVEDTNFPEMDVLAHESGHNFAWKLWGRYDPPLSSEYGKAQRKEHPVSRYAAISPSKGEDFAEACMWYSGYKPMRMYKPESLLSRVKGVFGGKKVSRRLFDDPPTEGFFERTGKEGRERAKKEFKEKFPRKYDAIDRLVKGGTK